MTEENLDHQTSFSLNRDEWDKLGDMVDNRAKLLRTFIHHYIETGEMDESVRMTRKSVMRSRLSTLYKEIETLEAQANQIEELLEKEDEDGNGMAIRVDLGRL